MAKHEKALGILALAAVVAYALACRPSWSPDSSQVAFPFAEEAKEGPKATWGVAIYDIKLKECRRIFETRDSGAIQVVWLPSGESLIALAYREKKADFVRLDLKNGTHKVVKSLTEDGDMQVEPTPLLPPTLSQGRYLWFMAEKKGTAKVAGLLKIDGVSGKAEFIQRAGFALLAQNRDAYAYTVELPGEPKTLEIGTFDPIRGHFHRIQWFPKNEIGGVLPFVAVNQGASRFVLPTLKDDRVRLLLLDSAGKTVSSIPCPATVSKVSHLTWGQASRTVWFSAATREKLADNELFGLVEMNIESGESRLYPLRPAKGNDDFGWLYLQPSLSPDKKWLAVCPSNEQEKETGLLLFDLTTPERKMTKVAIPPAKEQPRDTGKAKGKE